MPETDDGTSTDGDTADDAGTDTGATDPGTESPAPEAGTGTTDNAALNAALADAQSALDDRAAAYASNDLVAAAEADQRLQTALEDAVAASGQ